MSQAIYLFCLIKKRLVCGLQGGPGLQKGFALRLHDLGSLAAVVCPVSLDDFTGPEAEARLEDMSWLMPRIKRHEQVVEQAMALTPVLPLRFGTIFSSLESLEKQVRPHRQAIEEFLNQAASREEWAVKAYWDKAQALRRLTRERQKRESERLAAMRPGQRYFEEKKLAAVCRKELGHWLASARESVVRSLAQSAVELLQRELLKAGSREGNQEMAANWACWVPRAQVNTFLAQVEKSQAAHCAQGIFLECSGPWPPYSFAPRLSDQEA